MFASTLINFNGSLHKTIGRILWRINREYYLVEFLRNDVVFRGAWKVDKCEIIVNIDA